VFVSLSASISPELHVESSPVCKLVTSWHGPPLAALRYVMHVVLSVLWMTLITLYKYMYLHIMAENELAKG